MHTHAYTHAYTHVTAQPHNLTAVALASYNSHVY